MTTLKCSFIVLNTLVVQYLNDELFNKGIFLMFSLRTVAITLVVRITQHKILNVVCMVARHRC